MAEIRQIVLTNLLTDKKLQNEVRKNNHEAFDKLVDQLLNKVVPDPSQIALDLEELAKSLSEGGDVLSNIESTDYTKNVLDMTFSRWNTTNQGIRVFLENWIEIYILAVAVKQSNKCADWITKVAVDLLGLMNIRVIRDECDAGDSLPTDYLPPIYIEGLFICWYSARLTLIAILSFSQERILSLATVMVKR